MEMKKVNNEHIREAEVQSKDESKTKKQEEEAFEPDFDLDDLPDLE